jgi:N-acetylglutamate synthase-like GNAT family acetyltransferase
MDLEFRLSQQAENIDRDLVHHWLSDLSYWAKGRSKTLQDAAIDASRNYSVHEVGSGRQVGYARVVTDRVTFAWLCDVFVDPDLRGAGVCKLLVDGVLADLDALGVRRTLLSTADAHGLYAQYGFEPLAEPRRWMGRGSV